MRIQGLTIPVFPLRLIDTYMDGYYIDAEGRVWSTKGKSNSPVQIMGSNTPSGRYYTLNKRTHRADDVFRRARNHRDFAAETSLTIPHVPTPTGVVAQGGLPVALPGRTHSVRDAAASKAYLLATLNPKGKLVFGTDPMFHLSEQTAKTEAERIAAAAGVEVVVLKIVGKVKVQKAVWE